MSRARYVVEVGPNSKTYASGVPVEPGFYISRPGIWVGPFDDGAEARRWEEDNPETSHDDWLRENGVTDFRIVKPWVNNEQQDG